MNVTEDMRLRPEQQAAVEHLTMKTGSLAILCGMAGTGKTTTLRACRERWEAAGSRVIGAALSGKAAKELQRGSDIQSDTLAMLYIRMDESLARKWRHHAKQLIRAARGKRTYKFGNERIDKKTVLVIDEAGMLGTREMHDILAKVRDHGGKVVLVGDAGQLQPISPGAPFRALAERLGSAQLTDLARQRDEKDRQVVRDMAAGDAERAIKSLSDRGLVSMLPTRSEAVRELVKTWSREAAFQPHKALIFCGTNQEAQEINDCCQKEQSLCGRINTSRSVQIQGGRAYLGDRVLFTKNERRLGVSNGDTGTVVAINPLSSRTTIRVDGGKDVTLRPSEYRHRRKDQGPECALRLGYAVTTHKGQGTTVDYAYVLAGGTMQDREISYVQLSRARERTRIFVDEFSAGANTKGLAYKMRRSRAKHLAHDLMANEPQRNLRTGRVLSS